MKRLEVKTNKIHFVLALLLGIFFVPVALALMLRELKRGFAVGPLLLGLAVLTLYGGILWLVRRGSSRSVKAFTEEGVTRNDGQRFAWADLSCVVDQLHRRQGIPGDFLWRTEIQFKNGQSAWLIPLKVSNFKEVREYVDALPCEHKTVRV